MLQKLFLKSQPHHRDWYNHETQHHRWRRTISRDQFIRTILFPMKMSSILLPLNSSGLRLLCLIIKASSKQQQLPQEVSGDALNAVHALSTPSFGVAFQPLWPEMQRMTPPNYSWCDQLPAMHSFTLSICMERNSLETRWHVSYTCLWTIPLPTCAVWLCGSSIPPTPHHANRKNGLGGCRGLSVQGEEQGKVVHIAPCTSLGSSRVVWQWLSCQMYVHDPRRWHSGYGKWCWGGWVEWEWGQRDGWWWEPRGCRGGGLYVGWWRRLYAVAMLGWTCSS